MVRHRQEDPHAAGRAVAARPGAARHNLKIPVKLGGLNPGEDAKIVIAAVDVGILNLTNYKPPAPDDYYLGQRRLTSEIRDLYGQLIDGMQGTRGQIRTGGDGAGAELQGSPPTQSRWRSIPGSSRSGLTAPPKSVSIFRSSPARRVYGGGVEHDSSAAPRSTSPTCAIPWC